MTATGYCLQEEGEVDSSFSKIGKTITLLYNLNIREPQNYIMIFIIIASSGTKWPSTS